MAELSPRARTFVELSEKYSNLALAEVFREAERVLFGVALRDSAGLSGVTQRDLQRMFMTYALEGGVPWPPAPLDVLFLFETTALFRPFLFLPAEKWHVGRLWGLYVNATLKRLSDPKRNLAVLQYQVFAEPARQAQRSSLPAVATLQADIESVLEVKRGHLTPQTESHLNGLLYWLGEWREGALDFDTFTFWTTKWFEEILPAAFDGYAPDLDALRKRVRRSVFAIAKKGRQGQLGWYPRLWAPMVRAAHNLGGFFLLPKLCHWKDEAQRLRRRHLAYADAVRQGFIRLHVRPHLSSRCGRCGEELDGRGVIREEWLGATRVWVAHHRSCARKFYEGTAGPSLDDGPERKEEASEVRSLRLALRTKSLAAEQEEDGDDDGGCLDRYVIVRKLAYELLDAVVPAHQSAEPDTYYEAKKRVGLIQTPDVQSRGLPTSKSLERRPVARRPTKENPYPARPDKPPSFYLEPGHPKGISRALTERLRDWTVAALLDEYKRRDLSLNVFDTEDEDGGLMSAEERLSRDRPIIPGEEHERAADHRRKCLGPLLSVTPSYRLGRSPIPTVTEPTGTDEGSHVLAVGVEEHALSVGLEWMCQGLSVEKRELLEGAGTHRSKAKGETPLTDKQRKARERLLGNMRAEVFREAEKVLLDVKTVRLLEERRGGNPPRPRPPRYLMTCLEKVPMGDWDKPASLIVQEKTIQSCGGHAHPEPRTPTVFLPHEIPQWRAAPTERWIPEWSIRKLTGPFGVKWDEKKCREDSRKREPRKEPPVVKRWRPLYVPPEAVRYMDATPRGCWLWQQKKPPERDEIRRAWRLVYGEIPDVKKGKQYEVRQTCGNPRCVNPDHLSLDPPRPPWRGYGEFERTPERELVKVKARGSLRYNGHRYERDAVFYAYKPVAEAAVTVGAVAFVQEEVP